MDRCRLYQDSEYSVLVTSALTHKGRDTNYYHAKFVPPAVNWQYANIVSDNGQAPTRRYGGIG